MRRVTTVVGATGMLGGAICQHLATGDGSVRALVRPTSDPRRVERLTRAGVEVRQGELKDQASVDTICEGSQAVISTASCMLSKQAGDSIQSVDLEGQLALVDAARRGGVEHFIYISFPPLQGDFPLQEAKRAVERELMRSGIPRYTVLRPTFFTDVWLSPAVGFDVLNARARIFGTGEGRVNWISIEDVARFTVGALESPRAQRTVLELGGEEALSQLEVVRLFEEQSGRTWVREHVPEHVLREQFESATDPSQRSFAALMLNIALGCELDPRPAMDAIPVRPSRVEDSVRRMLAGQSMPLEESRG